MDDQGKRRLNSKCKSNTMKIKFILLGIFAFVKILVAAPHTWVFSTGKTFEGDYYSSGTAAVVVRNNGTNYTFTIANLSKNDQAYVSQMLYAQRQARLDAKIKQMQQAGLIELSAKLVENFPEKVRNQQKGWMDATFNGLSKAHIQFPDMELGLDITDKNDDGFYKCGAFLNQ
jgi:hypothetical protein